MTSLFEVNKSSLKRLFTFHEKDGTLKFTDLLKLCSSTRVFPDLLSSPDLHKILVEVAKDPETSSISQNLTFAQFELFLKSVAFKSFPNKPESEQETLLFMHLKSTCNLRYSVEFETMTQEKKTSRKVPRLNIDSTRIQRGTPKSTRRVSLKPSTTKNVKSSSFLFRSSPNKQSVEAKHKHYACSIVTPRVHIEKLNGRSIGRPLLTERNQKRTLKAANSFVSSSNAHLSSEKMNKLAAIISKFKERSLEKETRNVKVVKFAKFLVLFERKAAIFTLQEKLAFKIWGLVTSKLRKSRDVNW